MALLLFGGPLTVLHEEGAVLVGGWLKLRAAAQTAVLVKHVRAALDALLEARVAATASSSSHGSSSSSSSSGRSAGGGGQKGVSAGRGSSGSSHGTGRSPAGAGEQGVPAGRGSSSSSSGSSSRGSGPAGRGEQGLPAGAERTQQEQRAAVVQTIQQLLLDAENAGTARLEGRS